MQKKIIIYVAVVLSITLSSISISKYQAKVIEGRSQKSAAILSAESQNSVPGKTTISTPADLNGSTLKEETDQLKKAEASKIEVKTIAAKSTTPKTTEVKKVASRGAAPAAAKKVTVPDSKAKVELLDWWKEAQYVFKIGTVAKVTDVATGKSFMVKRTMGANHADSEALTKEDAQIIKSIWGSFNWNVRPVIITVNGRRLAASMSSLPHAGVDSAPAFAVVDNRSEGYGRGENLDVVKGNGMNGHFDIHFLNSTRHKDGQIDPKHQAAILKAAGK